MAEQASRDNVSLFLSWYLLPAWFYLVFLTIGCHLNSFALHTLSSIVARSAHIAFHCVVSFRNRDTSVPAWAMTKGHEA